MNENECDSELKKEWKEELVLCVCNFSNVSLKGIWWVVPKQLIKKLFKQWLVNIVYVHMCI